MQEEIKNKIKGIAQSVNTKIALRILGALVVALIIFQTGVAVGFHKATFNKDWDDHYYDNFGPRRNPVEIGANKEFPNAHGANGQIVKVELPNIIVQDRDDKEKVVVLNDQTKIMQRNQELKPEDLAVDTFVVILGNPNDQGQIEAKFIRLMPNPGANPPPMRRP